jgi:ribosomal protein S18 acetylase RimI-like enzyme
MEPITIRKASKDDAEVIADLSRTTFYETFAPHNTKEDMDKFMAEQFGRELLIEEVLAPDNLFFLAFIKEKLSGYAYLREKRHPSVPAAEKPFEVARIYVSSHTAGKGIGKMLMEKCISVARKKGSDTLWLGVWEHNQHAIGFYKKNGFEKFGTTVFVLGNDKQTDWLMKKQLPH